MVRIYRCDMCEGHKADNYYAKLSTYEFNPQTDIHLCEDCYSKIRAIILDEPVNEDPEKLLKDEP